MAKTFKTPKGTELELINLKGKDYLIVANRLLWFVEEVEKYSIETNFLQISEDSCVAHTSITVLDKDGRPVKHVTGTKKETKKDFADFVEKAETGSLGRALAYLGYGTQFAQQDMEEGMRLADAPLATAPKTEGGLLKPSFRKATPKAEATGTATGTGDNVVPPTTSNGSTNTTAPATDGWE
jgi:hypothetical protein